MMMMIRFTKEFVYGATLSIDDDDDDDGILSPLDCDDGS